MLLSTSIFSYAWSASPAGSQHLCQINVRMWLTRHFWCSADIMSICVRLGCFLQATVMQDLLCAGKFSETLRVCISCFSFTQSLPPLWSKCLWDFHLCMEVFFFINWEIERIWLVWDKGMSNTDDKISTLRVIFVIRERFKAGNQKTSIVLWLHTSMEVLMCSILCFNQC